MTGELTRYSVLMVVNGTIQQGEPQFPTFIRTQAEALRKAGCEIFVSVVDDRTSIRGILRNLRRLRTEIARAQPQIVHAQYGSATAAIARSVRGQLPLVVSFCGDDLLGTPQPEFYWRVRERCARSVGLWAASSASAIIVKSRNLLEALPDTLKERAVILSNGVDTSWFKPIDQGQCRSELGWSKESRVVLFNASRNEDRAGKNPDLAAATVSLLARSFPGVRLHMISNLSGSEVRLTMNAADCLLVTSLHEGSPNIVKEAMACNLPVVSVPCGDVAERLQSTYPGAVGPYDPSILAQLITKVFEAGCRSNGREQLIAQRLTATDVTESLMRFYRDVLERQRQHNATDLFPHVLVNPRVSEGKPDQKNASMT